MPLDDDARAGERSRQVCRTSYLRPHYESPVLTLNANAPAGALVISRELSRGGTPVSLDTVNQTLALALLLMSTTVWFVHRRAT
jgi:hypothetical protein